MYHIIKTLSIFNNILFILIIIVIVGNFTKREYPLRKPINKFLSKFQVPFPDEYKIFFLLLIPIVGQFIIFMLWKVFPPTYVMPTPY